MLDCDIEDDDAVVVKVERGEVVTEDTPFPQNESSKFLIGCFLYILFWMELPLFKEIDFKNFLLLKNSGFVLGTSTSLSMLFKELCCCWFGSATETDFFKLTFCFVVLLESTLTQIFGLTELGFVSALTEVIFLIAIQTILQRK